ncbi:amidohydrolase [Wenzhouxiangella sp. XN79A]|uniref:amidohydrolase n=1 Tax=Wenzhouxiangella sp. XN79A TaxID=2724193 RepID=UPI00144A7AE2|nr:amidohydrolase [Wenzhouxiangella sp. XN79A]NKI34172.1 amidohydrolase [Wenzhouxiangella sp. XN79A]
MNAFLSNLLISALVLSSATVSAAEVADTIYHNGPILTLDDDLPLAEAVAVKDGRILAVGAASDVLPLSGDNTRLMDLEGRTLVPGFVESHGHTYMMGLQAATANLLPPPDGNGADVAALQRLLSDWTEQNAGVVERVGWIIGFGYDDSQLTEQRHPTRQELDAVSTDYPVIIIHQSGHLGVANTRALELAEVTAETPDPPGGVFRREADGSQPNGVMEEYAFFYLLSKLAANFDQQINETLVVEGARLAASFGYTTLQEGRSNLEAVDAMRQVAANGGLEVDLVTYPDVLLVEDVAPSLNYSGRFRVGGVKLTIDGSPQGKTAFLSEPYFVVPEGQPEDYRGYAAIDAETVTNAIDKAYANGWQILTHANGDAAIDMLIEAVRNARQKYPDADVRPVLIHGQTVRKDQVAALDELGIFPSLFPMHTFYWGDWHRESVLGPERADNISPTGWVLERGMMFGSHTDAPVALPDSMRVLSSTVTRRSRTGDILGPIHRVTVEDGLKALSLWPAWQHFEEDRKGSITAGKLADFAVLSDNPMTVPEDDIAAIRVLRTIKEDEVVYSRPAEQVATVSSALFGVVPVAHSAAAIPGVQDVHGDGCFNRGLSVLYTALTSNSRRTAGAVR